MNFFSKLILLVEDNDDDVVLTQTAFEQAGIECAWQVVSDGEQAVSYLKGAGPYEDRASYPLPTVILLDLGLPKKSGYDVLAWMRGQSELASVIRVVLTGSNNPKDSERAYALGSHGYLQKPLTAEQLNQPGRTLKTVLRVGAWPRQEAVQAA